MCILLQVVRSLKNSMQPGATDISVEFHVPGHECVLKAPKVIPSLFTDDRLIVYGIFKSSKASNILQGRATLKYTISGKETTSKVPFFAIKQVPTIPVIHHLAAKERLLEYAGSYDHHEEMVALSIESGVVCSQTAFIAVNENSQKPVSGPIYTYDLHNMVYRKSSLSIPFTVGERGPEGPVFAMSSDDELTSFSVHDSAALYDDIDTGDSVSHSAAKPSLSSLVALQLANGSWSLTGALCSELGKELKVVEDSCPSGCPSAVWATALALSSLKLTYSSQQDEWELVAKKAEAWLKKQSLPAKLTLQNLHSEAERFNKL